MSAVQFERLQRQLAAIISRIAEEGPDNIVAEGEAERLFHDAWAFHHSLSSPDRQALVVQAAMVSHVAFAAPEQPNWNAIAQRGVYADGRPWFIPAYAESRLLYARLLTNCAVAACVSNMERYVQPLSDAALFLFGGGADLHANRWVGTLHATIAHVDASRRSEYAQIALQLLESSAASQELRVYVTRLLGEGDGMIVEKTGLLGSKIGRQIRPAYFGRHDLYLFREK
ncbi:MAG TPA: hypothetical protein VFT59_04060 [Candidatus Saccharimonadales bacterium]|nr:hypothetical protein [Candidatus Saccharimonadales bacterium]